MCDIAVPEGGFECEAVELVVVGVGHRSALYWSSGVLFVRDEESRSSRVGLTRPEAG